MRKVLSIIILLAIVSVAFANGILTDSGKEADGRFVVSARVYAEDGQLLYNISEGTVTFSKGKIVDLRLPNGVSSREGLLLELEGEGLVTTRASLDSVLLRPLHRETPSETGETTEDMATHLQIGRIGETDDLVVHSPKVGFGVTSPNERIDVDGAIAMKEGTAPTATTAYGKVYVNDADGHLYFIDEAGNITDLTVDANALQSVSSSAYTTGRTDHMRIIPGRGTDVTESATNDTIYISYNVDVTSSGVTPCSSAPSAPALVSGASTVCTGEPGASYAVPPVATATFYNWTVPSDAVITSGNGTNSVNVIFGSTDGNVCAKAFNDCGESSATCVAVSLNRPTSPGSITGTSPVCAGQTGVSYYIASVPGATNYIWTLPPGTVLASGTGTPNITVNFGTSGGDICVQTENSCGVSTPVCMPVVMTTTPATPGIITGSAVVCEGATGVSYSISPVAEATSYTWTVPSGATITAGSSTEAITVDFGTTSGDVCVTASSICGTSSPRCLAVTVNLAPEITVNPSNQSVDAGDPATFNITATGSSLSYQWQQSTDAGASWGSVGSDSDSYSTGTTTGGMDGYQYRCIVSGACTPSDTSTVATLTVTTDLYPFTSHTFTNAGVTGRFGPTLSQCRSSYSTSWDENPAYFNMSSQGIQEWTVPADGNYRIEVWGAGGGSNTCTGDTTTGKGARMRGDFTFTRGDVIHILVGQRGSNNDGSPSGGGGSFVVTSGGSPLIVAGGGGGRGESYSSAAANATTSTTANDGYHISRSALGAGGTGGSGGGAGRLTPGGGGFSSNGAFSASDNFEARAEAGYAYINGGNGGFGCPSGHTCCGSWSSALAVSAAAVEQAMLPQVQAVAIPAAAAPMAVTQAQAAVAVPTIQGRISPIPQV